MEKVASGLLGGASGGVLGLLLSSFIRTGQHGRTPLAVMAVLTLGLAIGMALLNLRQKQEPLPVAPRAVWGLALTAAALLIALAVFLFQSAYIHMITGGGQVQHPLSIWPVSRVALGLSLFSVLSGVALAFLGLAEMTAKRGEYGGRKWVVMALLAAGAWAGLALACYSMGYGLAIIG